MNTTLAKRTIVLLGAGHTHAHILRMWQMEPIADARLVLVSDAPIATYSGMMPGTLALLYTSEEMQIDLVRLCRLSGVLLIRNRVTGVDSKNRQLLFADRPSLPFDVLSIGIGSVPQKNILIDSDDSVLAIKPMQTFLQRLDCRLTALAAQIGERPLRVAIAGGGIAGLEIAFCLPGRLRKYDWKASPEITLIDKNSQVGRGLTAGAVRAATRELAKRGVRCLLEKEMVAVQNGSIELAGGATHPFDLVLLATSAVAPELLSHCGLKTDERGFLLTDATLKTNSLAPIFAVGDSGTIAGLSLPKAGVYAVRQGPVLWENLRRQLHRQTLVDFRPQRGFLKLVSTGDQRAIVSYRGLGFHAHWCWKLKDWIDRRFMRMYQEYGRPQMAPMQAEHEPKMRCVGCGGKVGGEVLSRVLHRLEVPDHPAVQVGLDNPDDAAVITVADGRSVVATHDFFAPPLDDLYLVGQIAMLNAASDLFAMGSRPTAALAAVTLPFGPPNAQEQMLLELMAGAVYELGKMGATLAGGHTIEGPRVTVGFTLLGEAQPKSLTTKTGLQPGDLLVLTKPLGTGVLLAAHGDAACRAEWMQPLLTSMLKSNQQVAQLYDEFQIRSATDVTGFGLAGHLLEMLEASEVGARLQIDAIPFLPGAAELFAAGQESTMAAANRAVESSIEVSAINRQTPIYPALFDPQTSGGLLLGVDPSRVEPLLKRLAAFDGGGTASAETPNVTIIGEVIECEQEAGVRLFLNT